MISTSQVSGFFILSQLDELRNAWEQSHPERSEGGLLALSGFEHQFLLTLLKIVRLWKASTETERQELNTAKRILAEAISDITESGIDITVTQVKRTLSDNSLRKALEELWVIFSLASDRTPDLANHLRFVISGKFRDHNNLEQVIQGWGVRTPKYPAEKLKLFKRRVRCEIISDPRTRLSNELQTLARDEDTETTIARWLGYLLQVGSGFSPESISTFIWKELIHDQGLEAFRVTFQRLFSLSQQNLSAIRHSLGENITLPRVKLSELKESVIVNKITLLLGSSGSGKSGLCKVGIQQVFWQDFDCLFLHASNIASFMESPDVAANRGMRRLDELLNAGITQKPALVVIDDLSDADDQHFNAVLNLLQSTLTTDANTGVRFILVAHIDAKDRVRESIAARFGMNSVCTNVELPQLPIDELQASQDLPESIHSLVHRHQEFGPALNLKLIDWLVRSVQRDQIDVSVFKNDLDLLGWFWRSHVQNNHRVSDASRALIKIAGQLADRFTPDLPLDFDPTIKNAALQKLIRSDCLRIIEEKNVVTVTHRWVGDCARFYELQGKRRELETEHLVERLRNPLWVQPIRWFALRLAVELEENETWQDLMNEALRGQHLQLIDLLLDGAILSKQPGSVLQKCSNDDLPFVVERLITRLLTIATDPYPSHPGSSSPMPLQTRIAIQEQITGIPKADLWEPVCYWLLSQSPEIVIKKSCIVFKAAEAWLNWSQYAERFPLRSEVAEFILGLAQIVLLPETKLAWSERYHLGRFESDAFKCIVFALKIIPERSTWLLRTLAGREIVSANKLEPIREATGDLTRDLYGGDGVLQPAHPHGPLAEVNDEFRKFMLSRNGLYLNAVIRTDLRLGIELFLALIIQPPQYLYPIKRGNDYLRDDDLGTEGSCDIDICTYKFLPLLSLLEINEEVAIRIIAILCEIATCRSATAQKPLVANSP